MFGCRLGKNFRYYHFVTVAFKGLIALIWGLSVSNVYSDSLEVILPSEFHWQTVSAISNEADDRYRCAQQFKHHWAVLTREDGVIQVQIAVDSYPPEPTLPDVINEFKCSKFSGKKLDVGETYFQKVDDGYLVAFNQGEFGGEVWWVSLDGNFLKQMSDNNINGFVQTTFGLIGLEGIAHLGDEQGSLLKFDKDVDGNWFSKKILTLNHSPNASLVDENGNLIVLTTSSLLRVTPKLTVDTLYLAEDYWIGLWPTSLAKSQDGVYFIGLRYAVARLTPTKDGFHEEWLVPKICGKP